MSNQQKDKLKTYRPFEDTTKAKEYLKKLTQGYEPAFSIPPQIDDWDMVFLRIILKCEELDNE